MLGPEAIAKSTVHGPRMLLISIEQTWPWCGRALAISHGNPGD